MDSRMFPIHVDDAKNQSQQLQRPQFAAVDTITADASDMLQFKVDSQKSSRRITKRICIVSQRMK